MQNEYWVLAIVSFLFVLSRMKYESIESLRESIMEYLSNICNKDIIEEPDDIIELEEITDIITSFIIENKEIFSKLK